MSRYASPKAGEWIQPVRRGYRMACCDCGLVHLVDFRIVGGRVQFRAARATKATSDRRRRHRIRVKR